MVRIVKDKIDIAHVDLSVIPSLKCDLDCPFCMYGCSPKNRLKLSFKPLKQFLGTVDWQRITNFGFYGGEPSIEMPLYQRFIDLIPPRIPRFIITNGTWSVDLAKASKFLSFCSRNRMRIYVSGTAYHMKHQDRAVLEELARIGQVFLKDPDEIHPMGKSEKADWKCTRKCRWHQQPIRLAVFPTGHIVFQNCDGVYPVVGSCASTFKEVFKLAVKIRRETCNYAYRNINEIMRSVSS